MELKISLDEKAEELLTSLVEAIRNAKPQVSTSCECVSSPCICEKDEHKPDAEVEQVESKIDYEALHSELIARAVQIAKSGKKKEVKALTTSFGKSAVSELDKDQLLAYQEELEKLA